MMPRLLALAALFISPFAGIRGDWTPSDVVATLEAMETEGVRVPYPPAGPIILWSGVGFDPQPPATLALLQRHGFNQHLPLFGDHLEAAHALVEFGAPIQLMQGLKTFPARDTTGEACRLPSSPADGFNLQSWRRISDAVVDALNRYQAAGLTVDALWLDYEGQPLTALRQEVASQAQALNLPVHLPDGQWEDWRRQFTLNALSSYVAAPAREVFPRISVLNWTANLSYPASPLINALGQPTPVSGPLFFTHSNPYAYGNTLSYEKAGLPVDLPQAEVDAFYRKLLLQHVSGDAYNRAVSTPLMGSVPWVARVVPDSSHQDIPLMSRPAYRESLRHLWLRGIQGMMVFNSPLLTPEQQQAEIIDVADVWREFSRHTAMIRLGQVANFSTDPVDGWQWSALRNRSQAVLRVSPASAILAESLTIPLWPDLKITLRPRPDGQTYLVWRIDHGNNGYMLTEVR